nr:hypothetical protein [uncultured Pedobacter sp.]
MADKFLQVKPQILKTTNPYYLSTLEIIRLCLSLYMTKIQIKEEIQQVLYSVPHAVLLDVLDFLKKLQEQAVDKIKLKNNLLQILSEDKELLEKLAK